MQHSVGTNGRGHAGHTENGYSGLAGGEVLFTTSPHLCAPGLPGDVGYNLPASQETHIPAGAFALVRTGIKVQIPHGRWAMVLPRSSANMSGALVVLPGVIDQGFRGELFAMVHNINPRPSLVQRLLARVRGREAPGTVVVPAGHSVAQMVFLTSITPAVRHTRALTPSVRGAQGYGSTGGAARREG